MPWDAGGTPAELDQYLAAEGAGGRVLIPGCGTAYEVQAFLRAGYHVSAIDFSPAAVEMAKLQIGALPAELYFGDFFTYAFGVREFDVIYERAFLASLPRAMWHDYAARVYELLRQGGKLIGFFLYGDKQGGPPFCLGTVNWALCSGNISRERLHFEFAIPCRYLRALNDGRSGTA